jgi:hypothetical protein
MARQSHLSIAGQLFRETREVSFNRFLSQVPIVKLALVAS